ncbi:MAG: phosphatase PAP2 family protein [Spirobacillus cienkowskii]|jgi:membrane-associated phospholipid phosphatase|uniref:Phosphatase PAP2 family protein n=1 Tax=Spirobacillus cienkowskii TaxID=495820 RepID=A0A369KT99_9BACT|nr:MAG: phosphatase PAP2 family protein [Spirobacillus cienkowskii]
MKEKLYNSLEKINKTNANIIYAFLLFCIFTFKILHYNQQNFDFWIETIGTILQLALPFYVVVPLLWKKDFLGTKQMLKFLIAVLIIIWSLKLGLSDLLGFNTTRPRGGDMSFPSGHTAGAFLGSVFLTIRYGWKYALVVLPLAFYVAFSRIFSKAHWPADVVASIVICTILGLMIVRPFKK